jgi:ectoine hydroxylase-related dioxygenase (phytanoyl-CoA dioxygenase family)
VKQLSSSRPQNHYSRREDERWLPLTLESLRQVGYAVVEGVLDEEGVEDLRDCLYSVRARIRADVGEDRLQRAGELGVLRLMAAYDDRAFRLLELPEVLAVVDATVSETAILHLQNGFVLPSLPADEVPATFQHSFHRDFPRHLEGYVASLNTMITLDEFTAENGGTLVVPGTHQRAERPDEDYLRACAVPVECPAGSMIVFDSTLWHAAGRNLSGRDRLAVNQQFTRSWIKQQVDYVRALGDERVQALPARTQQLLGWYTRVVTSLDEYYQPAERRLYRSGQG